jgi:hypothetical protein
MGVAQVRHLTEHVRGEVIPPAVPETTTMKLPTRPLPVALAGLGPVANVLGALTPTGPRLQLGAP